MELLDTLLGAGVACAFFALGRWREREALSNKRREYQPVKPICGCGHHRSFHADRKDRCRSYDQKFHMTCTCQGYDGPLTYAEVMDERFEDGNAA